MSVVSLLLISFAVSKLVLVLEIGVGTITQTYICEYELVLEDHLITNAGNTLGKWMHLKQGSALKVPSPSPLLLARLADGELALHEAWVHG